MFLPRIFLKWFYYSMEFTGFTSYLENNTAIFAMFIYKGFAWELVYILQCLIESFSLLVFISQKNSIHTWQLVTHEYCSLVFFFISLPGLEFYSYVFVDIKNRPRMFGLALFLHMHLPSYENRWTPYWEHRKSPQKNNKKHKNKQKKTFFKDESKTKFMYIYIHTCMFYMKHFWC